MPSEVRSAKFRHEPPPIDGLRRSTRNTRGGNLLLTWSRSLVQKKNSHKGTLYEIDMSGNSSTNKNISSLSDSQIPKYRRETNSSKRYNIQSNTQNIDSKDKSFRGSVLGSYFPFLQYSQPNFRKSHQSPSNIESGTSNRSITSKILNKNANETITVADLEMFLSEMQSSSYSDRVPYQQKVVAPSRFMATSESKDSKNTADSKIRSGSSLVAFPQPSILTQRELQLGTSVAGCFLGIIIGITILPNLWLVGMILGSLYGFGITKTVAEGENHRAPNTFDNLLISCGRHLARAYLQLKDYLNGLWFLYKTGQLSYEYYKTYENLDKKFAIQNKVDAWNRIFVEGKQKFDAWEQENEVGRTVLAGLRTAWLVDEQSRQRATGRSKYRVVQIAYDVKTSISRYLQNRFSSIKSVFQEGELKTFLKGLRLDMSQKDSIATRLGAVGAAIVAVNIFGAIFSISAGFSNFLAVVFAIVWPSWAGDLASRTKEVGMEIKSRGYNDSKPLSGTSVKVFDPVKFVRRRCEEQKSGKSKRSRSNSGKSRQLKRNRPKNRKPNFASKRKTVKSLSSSFRSFGGSKRKRRGVSGEVRTW
eukprot:CAMPEP_0172392840 /NCGR_PEP_ID=MMETSP1061-20121228/8847_1 /TAXON_ID=37318 /ORGANISM="Pseudo-nitzschia pungens, Strain cf. pungens" /LENGTH=587 /DNA_ID=CAMNT_0013123753 /DNA_START=128 /DNA_END=1888 /DNA_ORIENTATION=-